MPDKALDPTTHIFWMTVYDLAECGGTSGLNDVLQESLDNNNISHYASDISYTAVGVENGVITIEASYVPIVDTDGPEEHPDDI